jgi:hypothetical protein
MFKRHLQKNVEQNLFKGKVVIIYGARRVGKTTLCKQLVDKFDKSVYINCELYQYRSVLETTNSELLHDFLGSYRLVVLDEAQHIQNIGLIIKIIVDTFPGIQIIATGSTSFGLINKINEALTGRSRQFQLFPLSINEIHQQNNIADIRGRLPNLMRFGLYPEVFGKSEQEAKEELYNISSNYLYKDILQTEQLKRSDLIFNLLKALALQIGNEVTYNELAGLLGENVHTIKRYIELLEKSFVLFRLPSFSRNLRKEIGKGQKIYFYDTGIRNAIINHFGDLSNRNDVGGMWENFFITERMKMNHYNRKFVNSYFWRTYDQKEIDYIEDKDGILTAFEIKYKPKKKIKFPEEFTENYPGSVYEVITPDNFLHYLK